MNFQTGVELLELCQAHNTTISECMRQREVSLFPRTLPQVQHTMEEYYDIMKDGIKVALRDRPPSMGGWLGGEAACVYQYHQTHKSATGSLVGKAVAYAMGVLELNASMGLVVAAPTGGSCGVIPGCFLAIQQEYDIPDSTMIEGLFTAGAVGYLIMKHASVSGAECGCQAEVGSASAMAAAGITQVLGGTPAQCLHAAAYALSNLMGLVCDPVAGLVEVPCHGRNGVGAANALTSAEIALAGVPAPIPFDEVVDAMYRVGISMPYELRETALGGVATSPTAKVYACQREQG